MWVRMCGTACLPDVNLGEGGVAVLCLGVGWGVGGCLPDVDLGEGGVAAQCVDDHRRLGAKFGISDG